MNTLLTINIPLEIEEDLVDFLLSNEGIDGFTSYTVYGHGEHHGMTVAEQVAGRKKRLQYETVIADVLVEKLIRDLKEVGKGIRYWQMPVSNFGTT